MPGAEQSIAYALSSPAAARLALIELDRLECEDRFEHFVRQAWSVVEPTEPLIWNWHLDVLCAYLEAFFRRRITPRTGEPLNRLILNVPPGCMKSLLVSVMGPAWVWTWAPGRRFLNFTNELGLATRDSRRMKQVIQSQWYQQRWGHKVILSKDQSEKTNFENTAMGFRMAIGLEGNITGKRGTDLLIDDPVDAKKAYSDVEIASANLTYDQAVGSRLNRPARDGICCIMQRLRQDDLTGHLTAKTKQTWVQVRIPMEYEAGEGPGFDPVADLGPEYAYLRDPRKAEGELMFPQLFPRGVVEARKEDLGNHGTAGQLQQRPNPLGGGIIKAADWKKWPEDKPLPLALHVFSSVDTAFSDRDHKDSAYSARTDWMIFEDETSTIGGGRAPRLAMLMIGAWWDRVDYPTLRKNLREHHRQRELDCTLIERKASGISLLQDLRRVQRPRMTLRGFDPKQMGKIERAHLASPMFQQGCVYYVQRAWATKVIELVGAFPMGAAPSADVTDTVTQAVLYTKRRMWTQPPDEDPMDGLAASETEDDADDRRMEERARGRAAYG